MAGFDIDHLLQYAPPKHFCQKCRALNHPNFSNKKDGIKCGICGVEYLPTAQYSKWQYEQYLEVEANTAIRFRDPIEHGRDLARIARDFKAGSPTCPAIRALMLALMHAQRFVHFTSYGISHLMIGALKLAAQKVEVRGVVANADDSAIQELSDYPREAPRMHVHSIKGADRYSDVPHQKLVVIDGLLAFKGSANLTTAGWRKAERGMDLLEIVTDVDQIMQLHNCYFSPLWAQIASQDFGTTIEMVEAIPF